MPPPWPEPPRTDEPRRRRRARSIARRAPRLGEALLVVAVVGSALAIGAVHVPVIVGVAGLTVSAALIAARAHLLPGDALPAPALVALSLVVYTLLQALPLPAPLVALIAPHNADVWGRALHPFGEPPPSWISVSLDPGATLVEAVKWLSYAAAFTGGAALGARRGASAGALLALGSATLVALVTVGHGLVGATQVFGVYEPVFPPSRWHVGPLLNTNVLAGYLNFGVLCGLGAMMARRPILPRWALGLCVAAALGATVIAGSRGGLVALAIGLLVLLVVPRGDAVSVRARRWSLAATVAGGVLLAVLGGTSRTWTELLQENLDKVKVTSWAGPMIADHPWLGIGRGAFETVFPAYHLGAHDVVYSHAENFVAQWLSEWGVPVAVGAFLAFAWFLRPRALSPTADAVPAGVLAGTAAVLAQNLVDLGLEIMALPIVVSVALGACWGEVRRRRFEESCSDLWLGLPRFASRGSVAVAAAAAAGLLLLAVLFGLRTATGDRMAVGDRYRVLEPQNASEREAFRRDLRAAMLRHPAEPYFPRVGALLAVRSGDENPMRWINRALERAPTSGRNHYVLARILAKRGAKQQALLALRLALEHDPRLQSYAARMATRLTQSCAELERAAPRGAKGAFALRAMALELDRERHSEARRRCLEAASERDPDYAAARVSAIRDLLASFGRSDCAESRREACTARIQRHLAALDRLQAGSFEPLELRASFELARGEASAAERLLSERCAALSDPARTPCLRLRVTAANDLGDAARFDAAARDLLAAGCDASGSCAETHVWLGDLLSARAKWHAALGHYRHASREDPSPDVWRKLARAAQQVGAHAEAAAALARAHR